MSELIIIGYDDHAVAQQAHDRVVKLQRDHIVNLAPTVPVSASRATAFSVSTAAPKPVSVS